MKLVLIASIAWGLLAPTPRATLAATTSSPTQTPVANSESLAPTTAPPWNPDAPVPARRPWEQVVNFPGRVLSLPLLGVGRLVEPVLTYGEASGWVPTSVEARPQTSRRTRWAVSAPHLGGRAGFGGSLELRQRVLQGTELGVRYAGTVKDYTGTFVRLTGRPLGLVYGNTWRPQERFFGIGAGTPSSGLSSYASSAEFVRLEATSEKPPDAYFKARTALAGWVETRYQVLRTGREPNVPSWELEYPELASRVLDHQVEHLVYGVSLLNDGRAGAPHWSHGTRLMASAERHDAPLPGLALHVGSATGAQFNRYTLEGETGTSFGRNPRTLRLMARVVDQSITSGADRMLMTDLSTLGGTTGLAGFTQGRFYDVDLLHVKASYIFPLSRRLEMDVHSEWGSVYGDVWQDAKFTHLENSYGVSLRAVYFTGPFASLGLNFSHEGARISYSLGRVE
jgi:hypothetical protein